MKRSMLFFAFLLSVTFCFANSPSPEVSCPLPQNVTKVGQSASSISFDWDDCGCLLTEYRVFYVLNGNASPEYATGSSNFTFGNLQPGAYEFHFMTVCGASVSAEIIIDDIVSQ